MRRGAARVLPARRRAGSTTADGPCTPSGCARDAGSGRRRSPSTMIAGSGRRRRGRRRRLRTSRRRAAAARSARSGATISSSMLRGLGAQTRKRVPRLDDGANGIHACLIGTRTPPANFRSQEVGQAPLRRSHSIASTPRQMATPKRKTARSAGRPWSASGRAAGRQRRTTRAAAARSPRPSVANSWPCQAS